MKDNTIIHLMLMSKQGDHRYYRITKMTGAESVLVTASDRIQQDIDHRERSKAPDMEKVVSDMLTEKQAKQLVDRARTTVHFTPAKED